MFSIYKTDRCQGFSPLFALRINLTSHARFRFNAIGDSFTIKKVLMLAMLTKNSYTKPLISWQSRNSISTVAPPCSLELLCRMTQHSRNRVTWLSKLSQKIVQKLVLPKNIQVTSSRSAWWDEELDNGWISENFWEEEIRPRVLIRDNFPHINHVQVLNAWLIDSMKRILIQSLKF